MQYVSLSVQDAALLRGASVSYFKERFPEYSGLDLSLRDSGLIVSSTKSSIDDLIREIKSIKDKSEIAIGTSYVRLENNGKKILTIGMRTMSTIASLENPEISPVDSPIDYDREEQITTTFPHPSSRQVTPRYPTPPKGTRFLVSIEEVAVFGKIRPDELVACLDEETQKRYKLEESREQIEAIASRIDLAPLSVSIDDVLRIIHPRGLADNLGIEVEDVRATVAWYWLWKGAEAFNSVPAMAKGSIDNLFSSSLASRISPKMDAPTAATRRQSDATNDSVGTTATDDADTNNNGTEHRLVFRGGPRYSKDENLMKLLAENKITAFVNQILEGEKRSEQMIRAGANNDASWQNFFKPILKECLNEIPEPDRDKAAKKLNTAIAGVFKRKLTKVAD